MARLFPLEILHLLGYRKLRKEGPYLLVNRRRFAIGERLFIASLRDTYRHGEPAVGTWLQRRY